MKALQFDVSIPRWILCKMFGKISKSVYYGPLSMLHYRDIPEPQLSNAPTDEWVKIQKVKYLCVKCNTMLNFFQKKCNKCGTKITDKTKEV